MAKNLFFIGSGFVSVAAFALVSPRFYAYVYGNGGASCRCFPGDDCWPATTRWDAFNSTVNGRLIKTVPLGSPCHDPYFDAEACAELVSQWGQAPIHIDSTHSVNAAIFANASCDPFTPRDTPCLPGNYIDYAVNVSGPSDVAATIDFAEKNNIRLVVRNTGHDFLGRSTGAGALAIWTHHLKSIQVLDWSDSEYQGKAVKVGAGVQGFEVLQAASQAGLVVVTGECPTVGIVGGYTLSGGHSPLSSSFGLSADNTLEFEVVTPDGKLVRASSTSRHADLFWALSGGGSGNFGVVVSATLRAHPDAVTSGAAFSVTQPDLDYGAVLNAFHAALPAIIDSGTQVTYMASTKFLSVHSISGHNHTRNDVENALQPFVQSMAAMGVGLQPSYTQFDSYHEHWRHYYGPLPAGIFGGANDLLMGGRLLLRSALPHVGPALNRTLQHGVTFVGQAQNVSRFATPTRAVLPQWRDAVAVSIYTFAYSLTVPYADMAAKQALLTGTVMPLVEAVMPGAGAYINEANYQQPDWQEVFYGANYPRLVTVKRKYDPKGLFWHRVGVGSEGWKVRADERLCRA